jgi:hypothetical protein
MTKSPRRPYIPLAVRIAVAERQCDGYGLLVAYHGDQSLKEHLRRALRALSHFLPGKVELHHRPALVNRLFDFKAQDYVPPANDPAFLVYLSKDEHDIETRVRGVGAQRSDLGQRRYNKKVAKNRAKDKKRPGRWPRRQLRSKAINARWKRKGWPKRKVAPRQPEGRRTSQRPS